uniref:Mitochondrial escape protein 2 n=1 Tax=Paramoeba aestuarina TaxID=180227 RepID=A0A7S4P080_9EUKA|mmetsp:Transcript_33877/g.53017  ORF Transcript_33877/g.53017 Transcript_33877/m.53017 type:complete len:839 (+) Transcript_33877:223-2739(+)
MFSIVGRRILTKLGAIKPLPQRVNPSLPLPLDELKKSDQALVWVGNIYPIKRNAYDVRWMWYDDNLLQSLPPLFPSKVTVKQVFPRLKEGGAVVKIEPKDTDTLAYMSITDVIRDHLLPHLQEEFSSTFREEPRLNSVLGEPFLEDIAEILPTSRLKVQIVDAGKCPDGSPRFSPAMVESSGYSSFGLTKSNSMRFSIKDKEPLYAVLSKYGHIESLEMFTNPPPKDALPYAIVTYSQLESAISARTCLHRAPFPQNLSTHMSYLPVPATHSKLYDLATSNTRLSVFIGALFATALTFFLFDPLRQMNILRRVLLTSPKDTYEEDYEGIYMEGGGHATMKEVLASNFQMEPDSVLVITGPNGIGKSNLVMESSKKNGNGALLIKIGRDIHTGEQMIDRFVKDCGYFPSYGLSYQLGNLVDSLIPGSKTSSLNPTIDAQLHNILRCVRKVSKYISWIHREDSKQPVIVFHGIQRLMNEMDPKQALPLTYIICDFVRKVTRKHRAHVVFISDNIVESQQLRGLFVEANLSVDHVIMEEPSCSEIKNFISKSLVPVLNGQAAGSSGVYQLLNAWMPTRERNNGQNQQKNQKAEEDEVEFTSDNVFDMVLEKCGHRPRDIAYATRMVKGGRSLEASLESLVLRAENDWRTRILPPYTKGCTYYQVMMTAKELCQQEYVSYDDLLYNVYDNDPDKLNKMITSDVLRTVTMTDERTGKPKIFVTTSCKLYLVALRSLMQDGELRSKLMKATIRQETKLIHEKNRYIEQELSSLSEMVYRMRKAGTSVKIEPLEERQKKLTELMQRLQTRQQAVEAMAQWDPSAIKTQEKEEENEGLRRRIPFFY